MSNYDKMAAEARRLFLQQDIDRAIRMWNLPADDEAIHVRYAGDPLRIDRRTGEIGPDAGFPEDSYTPKGWINETMILFDLLCLPETRPTPAGRWVAISSLAGVISARHAQVLNHSVTAAKFAGRPERLRAACERLGGVPGGKADVGYVIPLFEDFATLLQFYDADDEFPATLTFMYDANALRYMHYETLWYVMINLCERLEHHGLDH